MEREDADIAEPAGRPLAERAAGGAGGVLDDLHPRRQHRAQPVDIGAQTEEMHRDDRLGPRRQPPRHLGGGQVEGGPVDIGEDRRRAAIDDAIRRRYPGEGRHDDLVAGADAERGQRQVQPGRGRADGDRVVDPVALGEGALECRHPWSLGQPAGLQRLAQRLPFLIAHDRGGDGDPARRQRHARGLNR